MRKVREVHARILRYLRRVFQVITKRCHFRIASGMPRADIVHAPHRKFRWGHGMSCCGEAP